MKLQSKYCYISNKQSGFGIAIVIIVAVVVLAILGCGGYQVYAHFNKPVSTSHATTANHTANTTQTNTAQATANYLDIKELGIKITLSDSSRDVIYDYSAANNSHYPQYVGGINLSTQSLVSKDSACKPESGANPLGSINKLSASQDQDGEGNTLVANGSTIFKLGNNYYILATPQSPCSSNPAVEALAAQQRATFAEDFKTVQLDQ